jgi:hypothetical protein
VTTSESRLLYVFSSPIFASAYANAALIFTLFALNCTLPGCCMFLIFSGPICFGDAVTVGS